MSTAVINIGNSDDKLSQKQWSEFVMKIQKVLHQWNMHIHFSGGSPSSAPWQNYCWVAEVRDEPLMHILRRDLSMICHEFRQDSIAITFGETEFVSGPTKL